MEGKPNSSSSENSPTSERSMNAHSSHLKRSRKLLYIFSTILIVVLVVVAAVFIPQGSGLIPLSVNYRVGEKLTYDVTETVSSSQGQPVTSGSINSTSTLEVMGFDGSTYTLNHTITMMSNGKPFSLAILENITRTGYVKYFFPEGTQQLVSNVSSNPILVELLSKPDVKIGDKWQIPVSNLVGNTSSTTGTVTLVFSSIEEITVPAGTYRIFRIDISADGIITKITLPASSASLGLPDTSNMVFSGQIYLEYGSCRQIKSEAQFDISYQTGNKTTNLSYSTETTLIQHTRP
jgi:hypothetical protein